MEGKAAMESIHRRIGHITVPYKFYVVVWSGFVGAYGLTRQNPNVPVKRGKKEKSCVNVRSTYCPTDIVWFYNCLNGMWHSRQTTGNIPHRTSGCSAAVLEDYLYVFGGIIEFADSNTLRYQNDLYRLHLTTFVWEKLSPSGINPPRSDKGVAWAYDGRVYFFGGYGPRPDPVTIDYIFQADISNANGRLGWNNNFFGYDPFTNAYFKPNTKGVIPDPRAAHSASVVNCRAFIFGGRLGERRTNDLYFINMKTFTWSHNVNSTANGYGPEGRSWLSFNFVSNQKAVVYGGLKQYGLPAMDYWECDFSENYESLKWTKCVTPIEPRVWHQAAFCDNTHELVIVGGVSKSPYDMEEDNYSGNIVCLKYGELYKTSKDSNAPGRCETFESAYPSIQSLPNVDSSDAKDFGCVKRSCTDDLSGPRNDLNKDGDLKPVATKIMNSVIDSSSTPQKSPFKCSMRVNTLSVPTFTSYITPEKIATPSCANLEDVVGSSETPRSHKTQRRVPADEQTPENFTSELTWKDVVIVESADSEGLTTPGKKSTMDDSTFGGWLDVIKKYSPRAASTAKAIIGVTAMVSSIKSGQPSGAVWGATTAAQGTAEIASSFCPNIEKILPTKSPRKGAANEQEKKSPLKVIANCAADVVLEAIAEKAAQNAKPE